MNHKKQSLLSLLTIGLVLMLSGCGNDAWDKQALEALNETKQGGTLTLWMFNTDIYLKPAAEEVAKEMNIKLNYEFINPERYKTKIKVAVSANELPDVFAQYLGKSEREIILNANVAAPLNDVFTSSGLESKFDKGSLVKEADGSIYSVPYRPEQSQVVVYNKKLMASLGIQPPKTWDELLAVIQTANRKGVTPIALGGKDRWPGDIIYNTLVLREDPNAFNRALNHEIKFTEKPFVDAADKVIQLVQANAFQPGYLNQSDLEARDLFYKGKALMICNGSWIFTKAISSLGDDLGYIKFPQTGAAADPFSTNTGERSSTPYGLFVNIQSQQLQKAKEFTIRYSLKINNELVKLGQASYADSEMKPEGKINDAYAEYLVDFKNFKFIQTYWYSAITTSKGEEYRDLNQKLYTGTLSSSQYTESMEQIMRKP
ncbi:ABC transporter substrate-binding protein [Paenibacillus aceris]|uniref:Raffinose/stachyose/melibiose transport system substrate-binding protein n=1 Tax=Paenibacillus aceris TaxID=869555 RepID=A0ABS4I6V1_9BACL|nr:extracellular solute-binding protein [Paenibacillus aceris]MBP1966625.1 raffinose/stachyose/melibiose transport system substrate-binding protein [Paenibacillus aceris]NHW38861.1 extracellular solute-binding protein [Paenibacillus aceris]